MKRANAIARLLCKEILKASAQRRDNRYRLSHGADPHSNDSFALSGGKRHGARTGGSWNGEAEFEITSGVTGEGIPYTLVVSETPESDYYNDFSSADAYFVLKNGLYTLDAVSPGRDSGADAKAPWKSSWPSSEERKNPRRHCLRGGCFSPVTKGFSGSLGMVFLFTVMPHLIQPVLILLAGEPKVPGVHQNQMVVRAAGDQPEALLDQLFRQNPGVGSHLPPIGPELRLQRLAQAHGLGGDDMLQRTALCAGEHRLVDGLFILVPCTG